MYQKNMGEQTNVSRWSHISIQQNGCRLNSKDEFSIISMLNKPKHQRIHLYVGFQYTKRMPTTGQLAQFIKCMDTSCKFCQRGAENIGLPIVTKSIGKT